MCKIIWKSIQCSSKKNLRLNLSSGILKEIQLIIFQFQIASEWIVLKINNCLKKNFKNSLFEHSYSWKFLIIDSKFASQNTLHYYQKFQRSKKSQKRKKNTFTNLILFTPTFSNVSNHHFRQIYTGHWFPHPSAVVSILVKICPNYSALDWFFQRKEELNQFGSNFPSHIFKLVFQNIDFNIFIRRDRSSGGCCYVKSNTFFFLFSNKWHGMSTFTRCLFLFWSIKNYVQDNITNLCSVYPYSS